MKSSPYEKIIPSDTESWLQNQKIFGIYDVYRLLLSLILFISFYFRSSTSSLGQIDNGLFLQLSVFYIIFNLILLSRPLIKVQHNVQVAQFTSIILIDLLLLILISYTCGGVSSGMAHLLIVPVATGSIIFRSRLSTFFAAVGSISAIYSDVYLTLTTSSTDNYYVQAGLLGLTLFAISFALQYLGNRIRQNEILTQQQAANIQSLEEMNHQIIQRMQTGIIVINSEGEILSLNNSAKVTMQANPENTELDKLFPKIPTLLLEQVKKWQQDKSYRAHPFRFALTGPEILSSFSYLHPDVGSTLLIFLEDFTQLSSRAQHLKLMSLGRLTASIAHEIRNPLGAISHASQLLNESSIIAENDHRLLAIIDTHTKRVNSIIENILKLSKYREEVSESIVIELWLEQFISKFSNSYKVEVNITLNIEEDVNKVRFNQSQLEQILTNLCENGLRYSQQATGRNEITINAYINPQNQCPVIDVLDEGIGISDEIGEQVFEPFFTTENSGTGLGLFICKELCEANQAQLIYCKTEDDHSCFRIAFAHPERQLDLII